MANARLFCWEKTNCMTGHRLLSLIQLLWCRWKKLSGYFRMKGLEWYGILCTKGFIILGALKPWKINVFLGDEMSRRNVRKANTTGDWLRPDLKYKVNKRGGERLTQTHVRRMSRRAGKELIGWEQTPGTAKDWWSWSRAAGVEGGVETEHSIVFQSVKFL